MVDYGSESVNGHHRMAWSLLLGQGHKLLKDLGATWKV